MSKPSEIISSYLKKKFSVIITLHPADDINKGTIIENVIFYKRG